MKVSKRKKPKKTRLHIAVKIHSVITMIIFVVYVCSGVLLGPDLLMRDLKNKYAFAADSVSLGLWIPGPPEIPVLNGYEQCDKGNLAIWLSWSASPDATSYDVYRNGELLISGISTSYYTDANVEQNSSYVYYVVAYGPLGSGQSNNIAVSTGICVPPPPPAPQCAIISFAGIDLTQYSGTVKTTNKNPLITGTTNLANAAISMEIYPGPIMEADTLANANGYWYWSIPAELPLGSYTIYVTATDSGDPTRISTTSLSFEMVQEEAENHEEDHDHDNKSHKSGTLRIIYPQGRLVPAVSNERGQRNISVSVLNEKKTVFRGQELSLDVRLENMGKQGTEYNGQFTYRIFDFKSKLLYETREEKKFSPDGHIMKNIKLPVPIGPGKYKISVFVQSGDKNVMDENFFSVRDYPFINMGGGILLTNETLVANLGWALIISLLLLLIFLILLWIEHRLYKHATRNVFDMDLEREGLIAKRKGVSR